MIRKCKCACALFCAAVLCVAQADASINGITVAGSTSTQEVGMTDGAGNTIYYIPLGYEHAGTYGVMNSHGNMAGMFADSGDGYGYNPATGLSMYMCYDLSNEFTPSTKTSIEFTFIDLDLRDINDPWQFYESVQFSYFDDNGNEVILTDTLLDASDGFGYTAVDTLLEYTTSNAPVTVTFGGAAFTNIVNEVADAGGVYQDSFYMVARFGSDYYRNATNTAEKLVSGALTNGGNAWGGVPEPGVIAIWSALALGGLAFCRRRQK